MKKVSPNPFSFFIYSIILSSILYIYIKKIAPFGDFGLTFLLFQLYS